MEYSSYVEQVRNLEFIPDEATADAAVKAVLGILVSRMDEEEARRLCDTLPQPLDYDTLRGHQVRPLDISVDQYFIEIGNQFNLDYNQARVLVTRVLHCVKESLDRPTIDEIEEGLPNDFVQAIEQA